MSVLTSEVSWLVRCPDYFSVLFSEVSLFQTLEDIQATWAGKMSPAHSLHRPWLRCSIYMYEGLASLHWHCKYHFISVETNKYLHDDGHPCDPGGVHRVSFPNLFVWSVKRGMEWKHLPQTKQLRHMPPRHSVDGTHHPIRMALRRVQRSSCEECASERARRDV